MSTTLTMLLVGGCLIYDIVINNNEIIIETLTMLLVGGAENEGAGWMQRWPRDGNWVHFVLSPAERSRPEKCCEGKRSTFIFAAFCNFQCNHRFRAGFIFSFVKKLLLLLSDSLSICLSLHICQYDCLFAVSLSVYLSVCLSLCLSVYLYACLFAVCLWLNQLLRVGVQATPVRAHRSFVNLEITKEPASRICCFVTEVDPITNIAPTNSKLQSTQIKKSQWNEIQIERS